MASITKIGSSRRALILTKWHKPQPQAFGCTAQA